MELHEQSSDQNCWWFGVNNDNKGHVRYASILSFLQGKAGEFKWPHGGSKSTIRFYKEMRPEDRVILWMGNGPLNEDWGIMGFCRISRIEGQAATPSAAYVLQSELTLTNPFRDEEILKSIFGEDFRPLQEVYGLGHSFDTVFPVEQYQYQSLWKRCRSRAA